MRGWTWQGGNHGVPTSTTYLRGIETPSNIITLPLHRSRALRASTFLTLSDLPRQLRCLRLLLVVSSQQCEWLYSLRRSECFYLSNKIFSYSFISICLSCVTFTFLTSSLLVSEATLVYIVRNIGQQLESYRTAYFKGLPRLTNRSDLNLFYMHRQILKFSFQQNQFHLKLKFCLEVMSVSARQLLMQHC